MYLPSLVQVSGFHNPGIHEGRVVSDVLEELDELFDILLQLVYGSVSIQKERYRKKRQIYLSQGIATSCLSQYLVMFSYNLPLSVIWKDPRIRLNISLPLSRLIWELLTCPHTKCTSPPNLD
jgi:hypothetical protein